MSKVKIIDRRSERGILSERNFLSKLNHPFIVNMHFAFQDYENLFLVLDLLSGGDLRYHIARYKKFTEQQTKFFIACIIIGLEYIHSQSIIHRDIKPENLVADKDGYIHITDFGVAKKNTKDNSSETSGTPGYMAPEVLFSQNHSYTADYFAIGVIGYEFMLGRRPYIGRSRKEIKQVVLNRQAKISVNDLPSGWSIEAIDFINKLLQRKVEKRLGYKGGISELKEHPWMIDVNWEEMLMHKTASPFKPKDGDNNYDKKYCESKEQVSESTIERYKDYMNDEEYASLFNGYTIINYIPKKEMIINEKVNIHSHMNIHIHKHKHKQSYDMNTQYSSNSNSMKHNKFLSNSKLSMKTSRNFKMNNNRKGGIKLISEDKELFHMKNVFKRMNSNNNSNSNNIVDTMNHNTCYSHKHKQQKLFIGNIPYSNSSSYRNKNKIILFNNTINNNNTNNINIKYRNIQSLSPQNTNITQKNLPNIHILSKHRSYNNIHSLHSSQLGKDNNHKNKLMLSSPHIIINTQRNTNLMKNILHKVHHHYKK